MPNPIDTMKEDPLIGFSYSFDVSDKISGMFTEISGIGSETEVVEIKATDQGGRDFVKKTPGRLKWTDITLKRGITSAMDFYQWRKQVEDGQVEAARVSATITMYNQLMAPIAQWTLERCWPSKISGPSLSAEGNAVGIEELTITYEYIVRVQ